MKFKRIIFTILFSQIFIFFVCQSIYSQIKVDQPADFKTIVQNILQTRYGTTLDNICPIETDATARRIFAEYGAIFISANTILPSRCIMTSDLEINAYQSKSNPQTENLNGINITLQKAAMDALLKANEAAKKQNLKITPRGGSISAARSFGDTVRLWNSRFVPGLNYWVRKRKISKADADSAQASEIRAQVAQVLNWETNGWFFSKDLSKSILYSVAAPGASQHNFMLALDVAEFTDPKVRAILADYGWFQTIKSDLPHFTYLGIKNDAKELRKLGLTDISVGAQKFWVPNIK